MQDDSDDAGRPADGGAPPAGTGDPRVDEAVAPLGGLAAAPVEEHVAVFERIHGKLREVLGELDDGAAGAAGR